MRKMILLTILIVLNACFFPHPNRFRLKRTNKKTDFQALFKSDSIQMPDTNAVYLLSYFNDAFNDSIFEFTRYFGNGRVYTSQTFYGIPPTEFDFNEMSVDGPDYLRKGQKHYYDITKDGLLKLEYFVNGYDGYDYIYAKVYPDSFVCFLRKPRRILTNSSPMNAVYVRKEVKLTNFNVDW